MEQLTVSESILINLTLDIDLCTNTNSFFDVIVIVSEPILIDLILLSMYKHFCTLQ